MGGGIYEQLNRKVEQQQQISMQKEARLEERSQESLKSVQKKAVEKINTIAEKNCFILFGNVEEVDGHRVKLSRDAQKEKALQEIQQRKATAGRKERARLKALEAEINSEGIKAVRKRLKQQIDEQTERALRAENEDYDVIYQKDLLEQMKVNICGDFGVDEVVRRAHLQRFQVMERQSAKLKERYAKTTFANKVLCQKLGKQAEKYIAEKAQRIQEEKNELAVKFAQYSQEYEQVFRGTLATENQVKRYRERVCHYQEYSQKSQEEAECEIQKRALVPATIRGLADTLRDYKANTQPRKLIIGTEETYEQQMKTVMKQVNKRLHKDDSDDKILEQTEAETLVKDYLKELLNHNDYRFRCGVDVLGFILDDKVKSQMETGTSGGITHAPLRMEFTQKSFGNEIGSLDATEYENYGYLASSKHEFVNRSKTSGYGQIAVKLSKERMKNRVTCTLGDSLGHMLTCTPALADDPDLACVGFDAKVAVIMNAYKRNKQKQAAPEDVEDMIEQLKNDEIRYFELQYHGDVTVRDMEEITITYPPILQKMRPDGSMETKEEAEERAMAEADGVLQRIRGKVSEINNDPARYGRKDMQPLKVNLAIGSKVYKVN